MDKPDWVMEIEALQTQRKHGANAIGSGSSRRTSSFPSTTELLAKLAWVKAQQRDAIAAKQERIDAMRRAAPPEIEFRGPTVRRRFPEMHAAMPTETLAWPDPARVVRAAEAIQQGGLVALVGNRGTGKTQLACWLATVGQMDTVYMRVDDLCGHLKAWLSLDVRDRNHNLMILRRCPLLVIDEFQERQRTEFEDLNIVSLLDKRYGENMPTVLIANLKPSEFAKDAGASIASRMTESGALIVCDWPSFRTNGANHGS